MDKPTQSVLAIVAGVNWLAVAAVCFGFFYTWRCESFVRNMDQLNSCYLQGGTIAGVGGMSKLGAAMYMAGYNTENPSVTRAARKREEENQ